MRGVSGLVGQPHEICKIVNAEMHEAVFAVYVPKIPDSSLLVGKVDPLEIGEKGGLLRTQPATSFVSASEDQKSPKISVAVDRAHASRSNPPYQAEVARASATQASPNAGPRPRRRSPNPNTKSLLKPKVQQHTSDQQPAAIYRSRYYLGR